MSMPQSLRSPTQMSFGHLMRAAGHVRLYGLADGNRDNKREAPVHLHREAQYECEVEILARRAEERASAPATARGLLFCEDERPVGRAFAGFAARQHHGAFDARPVEKKPPDGLGRELGLECGGGKFGGSHGQKKGPRDAGPRA